jgi:hypothetical protein
MVRHSGLWQLAVLAAAACGDNLTDGSAELVETIAVTQIATLAPADVLALALAPLDVDTVVVARAMARGGAFCGHCAATPGAGECRSVCKHAVIDVAIHRADGAADLPRSIATVIPTSPFEVIAQLRAVPLGGASVGVAWLECDRSSCDGARAEDRCTARYTTVDFTAFDRGDRAAATLYEDRYGDLQLAYDARSRQLLAVVSGAHPSTAGVHAAVFDREGARFIEPWHALGGSAASNAAITAATRGGFVVATEDPEPARPATGEPCASACDCAGPVATRETGGVFAHYPGTARPAERVAPGRSYDGSYRTREAIAVIDGGNRVVIAASQERDRAAELFEPRAGGWQLRTSSRAPMPQWIGVLGDADHIAWLGSDPADDDPRNQRLVAAVVSGDSEERGPILEAAAPSISEVLQSAPVQSAEGVTALFLLRGVLPPEAAIGAYDRYEVSRVRAAW